MLVGGMRALIVQTVHPLTIAGVAQHSQLPDRSARPPAPHSGVRGDHHVRLECPSRHELSRRFAPSMTGCAGWQPTGALTRQTTPTCSPGCTTSRCRASFWPISESVQAWVGTRPTNTFPRWPTWAHVLGVRESITTAAALPRWVRHHPEQHVTADARAAVRFLAWAPLHSPPRGALRGPARCGDQPRPDQAAIRSRPVLARAPSPGAWRANRRLGCWWAPWAGRSGPHPHWSGRARASAPEPLDWTARLGSPVSTRA